MTRPGDLRTARVRTGAVERRVRWFSWLGALVLRALALTWRVDEENAAPWRALRAAGRPFILALWHGEIFPLTWVNRGVGLTAMVSTHADGEVIARVLERWGYHTVRGSSSRGAGTALRGMIRELEAGREFVITPDGPRGPAGVAQNGVLLASERSGAPIVPMRASSSRAWRLHSWDRFLVPKPFARVTVRYGDPWVATGTDEGARQALQARMGPAFPTTPGRDL